MSEADFLHLVETCSADADQWLDQITSMLQNANKSKKEKFLSVVSKQGFTPAHLACSNNNERLLCILKQHKFALDVPLKAKVLKFRALDVVPKGTRPLHLACSVNSPECVNILLNLKVDVNALDEEGRTPAFIAASFRNAEVLQHICENLNTKPNLDAPIRAPVDSPFARGCTPLMAASLGSAMCVDLLLKQYVNPHLVDENGWTAAHYAAKVGCAEAVALLKTHMEEQSLGPYLQQSTQQTFVRRGGGEGKLKIDTAVGFTPLHVLAKYISYPRNNFLACVPLLIDLGVDPNATDSRGWTAAMFACMKADAEMLNAIADSCTKAGKELDFTIRSTVKVTIASSGAQDFDDNDLPEGTGGRALIDFPKGCIAYDIAKAKDAFDCVELIVRFDMQRGALAASKPMQPELAGDDDNSDGGQNSLSRSQSNLPNSGSFGEGSPLGGQSPKLPKSGSFAMAGGGMIKSGSIGQSRSFGSGMQPSGSFGKDGVPRSGSFSRPSSLQRYVMSKIMLEEEKEKLGQKPAEDLPDLITLRQELQTYKDRAARVEAELEKAKNEAVTYKEMLMKSEADKKEAEGDLKRMMKNLAAAQLALEQEKDKAEEELKAVQHDAARTKVDLTVQTENWRAEKNQFLAQITDLQHSVKVLGEQLEEERTASANAAAAALKGPDQGYDDEADPELQQPVGEKRIRQPGNGAIFHSLDQPLLKERKEEKGGCCTVL